MGRERHREGGGVRREGWRRYYIGAGEHGIGRLDLWRRRRRRGRERDRGERRDNGQGRRWRGRLQQRTHPDGRNGRGGGRRRPGPRRAPVRPPRWGGPARVAEGPGREP